MRKRLSFLLALVLVFSLFVTACGSSNTDTKTDNTGSAKETTKEVSDSVKETEKEDSDETEKSNGDAASSDKFVIGSSQPLSDTQAITGVNITRGAQLAIDEANAEGGINGAQIELLSYDDKGNPEEAVKIASRLVEVDHVDAVMGSLISSNMLATGQYFEDNKIFTIGTGLSPTWMEQGWEYIFRACANNGNTMGDLATKLYDMGVRTAAGLHGQDDANMSAFLAFQEKAEELGIEITTEEVYVESDNEFAGQINKMINTDPDVILFMSHTAHQGPFIKQLRNAGYTGLAAVKESLTADNLDVAGDAANNVAFVYPYVTYNDVDDIEDEAIKEFNQKYLDAYGELPTHDCAYRGYDSINVLVEAAKIAGSNDSDALKDAMRKITSYDALVGTLDFSESNDGLQDVIGGFIVLDGKFSDIDAWAADGGFDKLNQ